MAGSNLGYGRFFNDTHGTERTKRTARWPDKKEVPLE